MWYNSFQTRMVSTSLEIFHFFSLFPSGWMGKTQALKEGGDKITASCRACPFYIDSNWTSQGKKSAYCSKPPKYGCLPIKKLLLFSRYVVSDSLCDPMDCSMPGFAVLHYLLEFAQMNFHWVGDAIQPSHPLPPPSPPALNLAQHQGLFQWVSSSYQWPKYWSFSSRISPSNE